MSGKRDKKLRKAMRVEAKLILAKDPRSGLSFAVSSVPVDAVPQVQPPAEPPLSPEEKELTKLYKTFATTVWRMRNVLLDTETGELYREKTFSEDGFGAARRRFFLWKA